MLILEGIALSFWLLIICVVGIADGVHNMAFLYEEDVQNRVLELGLISKEKLARNRKIMMTALFVPIIAISILLVYGLNGARGFKEGFYQLTFILLFAGLFDRLFIDFYWVGKTKAWIIAGTEDLMPYIPKKTLIGKWLGTLIGFPLLAAIIALLMNVIG